MRWLGVGFPVEWVGLTGVDLDMLCARPDEQRRGAGGMLVKWGCDRADEDGVGTYVDASETGKALYEKFGFVNYSLPDEAVRAMARKTS